MASFFSPLFAHGSVAKKLTGPSIPSPHSSRKSRKTGRGRTMPAAKSSPAWLAANTRPPAAPGSSSRAPLSRSASRRSAAPRRCKASRAGQPSRPSIFEWELRRGARDRRGASGLRGAISGDEIAARGMRRMVAVHTMCLSGSWCSWMMPDRNDGYVCPTASMMTALDRYLSRFLLGNRPRKTSCYRPRGCLSALCDRARCRWGQRC